MTTELRGRDRAPLLSFPEALDNAVSQHHEYHATTVTRNSRYILLWLRSPTNCRHSSARYVKSPSSKVVFQSLYRELGSLYAVETSCKRHIRRCRRKQPTPPRQKSCSRCVRGKTRCDLRQPSCSQCSNKNLACTYPSSIRTDESAGIAPEHWDTISSDVIDLSWTSLPTVDGERTITDDAGLAEFGETSLVSFGASFPPIGSSFDVPEIHDLSYPLQGPSSLSPFSFNSETMTLSDPLLRALPYWTCEQAESGTPIPAPELTLLEEEGIPPENKLSKIRDRWINPSFKPPSRTISVQGPSAGFMTHVLKCYPKIMARDGSVPPIIHPLQSTSRSTLIPLVNCLAWTKIWEHRTGNDEAVLVNAMQCEFHRLYKEV